LYLSLARIWNSNFICRGLLHFQWGEMRFFAILILVESLTIIFKLDF
jgi:hypothetical protein